MNPTDFIGAVDFAAMMAFFFSMVAARFEARFVRAADREGDSLGGSLRNHWDLAFQGAPKMM